MNKDDSITLKIVHDHKEPDISKQTKVVDAKTGRSISGVVGVKLNVSATGNPMLDIQLICYNSDISTSEFNFSQSGRFGEKITDQIYGCHVPDVHSFEFEHNIHSKPLVTITYANRE